MQQTTRGQFPACTFQDFPTILSRPPLQLASNLAKGDPRGGEYARGVNRSRFSHPSDDTRARESAVHKRERKRKREREREREREGPRGVVGRLFNDNENFLSSTLAERTNERTNGWLGFRNSRCRSAEWTFHQRDARLSPSGHLFNLPSVIEPRVRVLFYWSAYHAARWSALSLTRAREYDAAFIT